MPEIRLGGKGWRAGPGAATLVLFVLALVLSAVISISLAASSTTILTNGGFETPAVTNTTTYGGGATAPASFWWTVPSGTVTLTPSSSKTGAAGEGKQFVELGGTSAAPGTVQTPPLATALGKVYTVQFEYSAPPQAGCNPQMELLWDGQRAGEPNGYQAVSASSAKNVTWTLATVQVVATIPSSSTTGDVLGFRSLSAGPCARGVTIDDVSVSPSQGTPSLDGVGQMTVSPSSVETNTAQTLDFTYGANPSATPNPKLSNGVVTVEVPPSWPTPNLTSGSAGYVTISGVPGTLSVSGRTIRVSGLSMSLDPPDSQTFTLHYRTTSGSPTPAAGSYVFVAREQSNGGGVLTPLLTSPVVTVTAPQDGVGTMSVNPTTATATRPGTTGSNSAFTFTYKADRQLTNATVTVDVPTNAAANPDWSDPSASGAVTLLTPGPSLSVIGRRITLTGVTLAKDGTVQFVYNGVPPSVLSLQTFIAKEQSTAAGALTGIGTSPTITMAAAGQPAAGSSVLQVNTTSDTPVDVGCSFAPGDCTLREAIQLSSSVAGGYKIRFDLSKETSLPATIRLASTLTFTTKVDLDGLDQLVLPSGANASSFTCPTATQATPSLAVQIAPVASGYSGSDGIVLAPGSGGSMIRGLSIGGFAGSGIVVNGSSGNAIVCNIVGTTGSAGIANAGNGITIRGTTTGNTVGSAATIGDRNMIAGNGAAGVSVADQTSVGNQVDGNVFDANTGVGIDLVSSTPGLPLNDVKDADAGPNGLQNSPVLIATSRADGLLGGIKAASNTSYRIVLYASPTCDPSGSGEGKIILGSASVTTGASPPQNGGSPPGEALFNVPFSGTLTTDATWYISATATGPDGTSEFSPCSILVTQDNSVWSQAATVPTNGSGTTGYLDAPGKSRWYRFPIQPNGKVTISLKNLPSNANYDIVAFSDIGQTYQQLSGSTPTLASISQQGAETPQSGTNSSQYSTSALEPTTIDPNVNVAGSAYFGSAYFGSAYFGSAYFGSAYFGSAYFGSAYFGSAYFGSAYFGSAYFGSAYFGSAYFGSAYFGSAYFDDKAFSNAQTTSVIGLAANLGSDPETLTLNTWNNTGYFYVRVLSPTGDTSLQQPFTLTVSDEGSVCGGSTPVSPTPDNSGLYTPPAPPAGGYDTVILTDSNKLDQTALGPKLATFAARSDVNGLVVDVNQDSAVRGFRAQADARSGCPYAKNLLAGAVKRIVTATRAASPGLKYVVVAGGDNVIPFFRTPDRTQVGHESAYFPPVQDGSASNAGLRLGYVLSQDGYGSQLDLDVKGAQVPVPNVPVGRLVETPSQIIGMIDAYSASGGVINPTSSLATGYDFVEDGARDVAGTLKDGIGGSANTTLITKAGVSPSDTNTPGTTNVGGFDLLNRSWTAADLKQSLLAPNAAHAPDLVFLGGHFSASDALAADYSTTLTTTDLVNRASGAAANYFRNTLFFSVGCHSGYNTLDGDAIPGVTQPLDWPQAFARTKSMLVAGTGFQYGDTDFVKYSEQLYAEFARQLRTGSSPVPIGNALVEAKQLYLQQYGVADAIDEKAVLEATLWGLPMMKVVMPNRLTPTPATSDLGGAPATATTEPGKTLGLATKILDVTPSLTPNSKVLTNSATGGTITATWLSGSDGIVANPAQPTLPLESLNVGYAGTVLRGVGFWGGAYTDVAGQIPLTGAPATELRGVHVPFFSDVFFPLALGSVNYMAGLDGTGGAGKERLLVTPAQYRSCDSSTCDPTSDTLRKYSNVSFKLFYNGNTVTTYNGSNFTPANAGPPIIASVASSATGSNASFSVRMIGDPRVGIQETWITWTDPSATSPRWQSLPLVQDGADTTLWKATLDLSSIPDLSKVRFMVQSANGVGLVTRDDNFGAYYGIGGTAQGGTAQATTTTLSQFQSGDTTGKYSGQVLVTVPNTNPAQRVPVSAMVVVAGTTTPVKNRPVLFTLGPTSVVAFTNDSGVATTPFLINAPPGAYQLTATLIGNADFRSSSDRVGYTVVKMPTATSLTSAGGTSTATAAVGDSTGIVATVVNENGKPVPDRAVLFVATPASSANGIAVGVVKTNYVGKARLDSVELSPGSYTITAYFGQDKTYNGVRFNLTDQAYQGSDSSTPVGGGGFQTVDLAVTSTLKLVKTASSAAPMTTVGQTVTYTYSLTNTGQAPLDGPITVTDSRGVIAGTTNVAANAPFTCLAGPLVPGATQNCAATTSVTQADLDAGSISSSAKALAKYGAVDVPSNADTATISLVQTPTLALTKSASPATYAAAGDLIVYTYTMTNNGNVTLPGPFTATDDHALTVGGVNYAAGAPFPCGSAPLALGASRSCTGSYTITAADVNAAVVTNSARASTSFRGSNVTSPIATASVTSRLAVALNGLLPTGRVTKNNYIWFNAVVTASNRSVGPPAPYSAIALKGVKMNFCALAFTTATPPNPSCTGKAAKISLTVPDTLITFDPLATVSSTVVDATGRWLITVPALYPLLSGGSSNFVFLTGVSWKANSDVVLKADAPFLTGSLEGTAGTCYTVKWGAAQYTSFTSGGSAMKVKSIDGGPPWSQEPPSDLAGTPEGPPNTSDTRYKTMIVPAWALTDHTLGGSGPTGYYAASQPLGHCS